MLGGIFMLAVPILTGAVPRTGVDALSSLMPYLKNPYPVINVVPSVIDIYVISLTVGFSFSPNLMSIIGVVIAVLIFRHT